MSSDFFKLVAIGPVDFELTLELTENDLRSYSIDLKKITQLKDCAGFLQNKEIQERIWLTSKNLTINMLLFTNRAFKVKTFIEYIILSEPNFGNENSFMNELFKNITEQNFLFLIPFKVLNTLQNNIVLTLKAPNFEKSFQTTMPNEKDEDNEETKGGDKGKKNLFKDVNYDFSSCNFFMIDLNDMLVLKPHGVDLSGLYEFIELIMNNKAKIIINYPNVIHNISLVNVDDIQLITDLLGLTDIYLFEKKEALAFFTLQSHLSEGSSGHGSTSSKNEDKSLEILFLKEIKKKRKLYPKIGIFLEDLNICTVIEQEVDTNLVLYHSDYDLELYKNHNITLNEKTATSEEIRESDESKKVILNNHLLLKSSFLGGFLSRFIHQKSFNTACSAGNELTKKVINLLIQKLPFSDPKALLVKIKKAKKMDKVNLAEEENKAKEGGFVLDCCNVINSGMNKYNPLYDDNLTTHFSSFSTRKHLNKVGFINKKGQILNDPDKNNIGNPKNKHLLKVFENEKKKFNSIKDNNDKMKLQINSLFQRKGKSLKNVGTADLQKFSKVNFNPMTNKKLPTLENTWDKHPLQKKAGSTLYSANITTTKTNLKPISKDLYIKLLNNFENKANKELIDREDMRESDIGVEIKQVSQTHNVDFYKKKESNLINNRNESKRNVADYINEDVPKDDEEIVNQKVKSKQKSKQPSKDNTIKDEENL